MLSACQAGIALRKADVLCLCADYYSPGRTLLQPEKTYTIFAFGASFESVMKLISSLDPD